MGFWGIPVHIQSQASNPQDTDVSTAQTIHQMIALAKSSSTSPQIASIVNQCIASANSKSHRDLVRAIFWWIKSHIQFVEDETIMAGVLGVDPAHLDQELLIEPWVLVSMPQPMGDCDDFSTLLAACLVAAHLPCWFVTIACDPELPFKFGHVYVKVYLPDEGVTQYLDCSHGPIPGWEQDKYFRKAEWRID